MAPLGEREQVGAPDRPRALAEQLQSTDTPAAARCSRRRSARSSRAGSGRRPSGSPAFSRTPSSSPGSSPPGSLVSRP
ncbi:hypothetical protein [Actinorugispora endophytica]|uniref:hypothetical protein n=1 Tax=Actinorugispora endophytica TaxID=1605990 RepID=UPI0014152F81|nr:hypothetical protein [Actinorugispora endophytica]